MHEYVISQNVKSLCCQFAKKILEKINFLNRYIETCRKVIVFSVDGTGINFATERIALSLNFLPTISYGCIAKTSTCMQKHLYFTYVKYRINHIKEKVNVGMNII